MQLLEGFKGSDFSEQVPVVLAVVIDKGDAGLSRLAKNHRHTSSLGLLPLIYSIRINKRAIILLVKGELPDLPQQVAARVCHLESWH